MRIDPALAALRSDDAPQRRAQLAAVAARDSWLAGGDVAPVVRALERYGEGVSLAQLPALERLMQSGAAHFARGHLLRYIEVAAAAPLAQWPVRHVGNEHMASLLLARSGRAMLSLVAYAPRQSAPPHAIFAHGERHETILAGDGQGIVVRCNGTRLTERAVSLQPGNTLSFDIAREALLLDRAERCIVALRLSRSSAATQPAREIDRASGRLVHQAAGALADSRREMMATLLARMGRREAVPVLDGMASDGADHVRWQALRELLALDTARGFARLSAIAGEHNDALREPARRLEAQLLARHPQLRALTGQGQKQERQPCPA